MTNNIQIVLLNAPPGSGKDYLADRLGFTHRAFSDILKLMTHALYGVNSKNIKHFEDCKDEPNEVFYGLTPRQAYINVSENLLKPAHGKDFFGKVTAKELVELNAVSGVKTFVVSDAGFVEEVQPLINTFGLSNLLLVKIDAPNCTWTNDSRKPLDIPGVKELRVTNNKNEQFVPEAKRAITEALKSLAKSSN